MQNRQAVLERVQQAIGPARQDGPLPAVLFVRLRRFRETNLLFGYEVGERLLDIVQERIVHAMRGCDEAWKVGDDSFLVLLPELRDRNHAALAAAKLVRVLQEPLDVSGHSILPLVSIGIAASPEDASDAELLCRYAEQACERAATSTDRYAFHHMPRLVASFPYEDLHAAIARNQLELYLQPIVDLGSGGRNRYEALARWTHPRLGSIRPDLFVMVAEQTGLIHELTRWSLNVALRHLSEIGQAVGPEGTPGIAVNIAVDALQQPGFVEQVTGLLRFWRVPPRNLRLEITESGLMVDLQHCEHVLGLLRSHGLGLAIDDFGTGYSSMAYLRRLPTDELKIDKSFIDDINEDPRAGKLVASMIDVSHHVGMSVVAEGIEDRRTVDLLAGMGCDLGQGYYFARPAPAAEVIAGLVDQR